ncbi:LemA family protein [Methylobacterium oryzihabitans]|uniref:LemA family protein n=2 Tax=Methylobacterium TaxID=407 RepID=A0A3S2V575_9HYPH|nr:LemA family protein [Methylobacterium oryzihabitans]RVU13854.1 LemA family protein [Methylobacterium oryzihabitans]
MRAASLAPSPSLAGRLRLALTAIVLATTLSACGAINRVPTLEEDAKSRWGEVQNQYQRRADLIPNLVETVKGYAQQEREVLTQVTEARAKASSVKVDASSIQDPEKFKQFQDAQNQLSGALGRLLVTVERYPDLKSNANFLALQSQLEGTENRIAVARRDYIQSVQAYNTEICTIPGRWIAAVLYPDAKPMQSFAATPESDRPPSVKF